jgi:hypothetical protein
LSRSLEPIDEAVGLVTCLLYLLVILAPRPLVGGSLGLLHGLMDLVLVLDSRILGLLR